jgi:signal transduction histidine kinase
MRWDANSLRFRYLSSTFIWILISLFAAGLLVSNLFRENITQGFHDEMEVHIEELAGLARVDKTGQPFMIRRLSDPRFSEKSSGFYWQIKRPGFRTLRSPSLLSSEIPTSQSTSLSKNWAITDGPTGKTIEYGMLLPAKSGGEPLQLAISSDIRLLDEIQSDLTWPLTWQLSLFALVMAVLGFCQVSVGLRPLDRLAKSVEEITTGRINKMTQDYPTEINPLVHNLNMMIDGNTEMVRSARLQAGNLAHGLRTPLAILVDEAQRLNSLGQTESSNTLLSECDRMKKHIDYHLARARTAGLTAIPGQSASIKTACERVETAMRRLHAGKGISICRGEFPDDQVACDEVDLGELISNLLDNACKWALSRVIISWERKENMLHFLVDDDGPGLSATDRTKVLNEGGRLDEITPGSGLGLGIVQDLVKLYGGKFDLENSPLSGLRARLILPIVKIAHSGN